MSRTRPLNAARLPVPSPSTVTPGKSPILGANSLFFLSARLPGTTFRGNADPSAAASVTLVLPRRNEAQFESQLAQIEQTHHYLTLQQLTQKYGASPGDITAVEQYAKAQGLTVGQVDRASRSVVLSGSVGQMNKVFGTTLGQYNFQGHTFRAPTGQPKLPMALQNKVEEVFGLDEQPIFKPQFVKHQGTPAATGPDDTSFNPNQIAKLYDFPKNGAAGQTVGIIELGGGYETSDMRTYFKGLKMKTPSLTSVGVDGAKNVPGKDPNGADCEVELDDELAGAMAPGAKLVDYFGRNTSGGFLDAINKAVHDSKNKPSVISISWGGPEAALAAGGMNLQAYNEALQDAEALGITVTVAAGDNGSSDGDTTDHKGVNVDFPGSSPNVLDVGGTTLLAWKGKISNETVWNDNQFGEGATGGGVSNVFGLPSWQRGVKATLTAGGTEPLTSRGAPDVAFNADPNTGYNTTVDGQYDDLGGTSAGAPAWAALIALANAANKKRSGDVHPALYANPNAFHDITQGNNGLYAAAPGWDATTGLGRPNGEAVVTALKNAESKKTEQRKLPRASTTRDGQMGTPLATKLLPH